MNFGIKAAAVALVCWCMLAAVGLAETKYVVEELEITLRTGPGMDRKIIDMIPSGRQLEVLTTAEGWSEVQMPNGKQGWVLARYLSDDVPRSILLERLTKKYEALANQKQTLDSGTAELSKENQRLAAELAQAQTQLAQVTAEHETLKAESTDFIGLKTRHESTLKELMELRTKANSAESELNKLSNNQVYQGMLYGGGLLALGFVVGIIIRRPKRRSGLL